MPEEIPKICHAVDPSSLQPLLQELPQVPVKKPTADSPAATCVPLPKLVKPPRVVPPRLDEVQCESDSCEFVHQPKPPLYPPPRRLLPTQHRLNDVYAAFDDAMRSGKLLALEENKDSAMLSFREKMRRNPAHVLLKWVWGLHKASGFELTCEGTWGG